jgi:predicted exporter
LEERLAERMKAEINAGHLRNFVSIARFAPSIERQDENRTLVRTHLHERLHSYREQIGLESIIDEEARDYLTLDRILSAGALALVPKLILFERDDAAAHIVTLEGVSNVAPLRAIADDIPGISFVDPTADYSSLFSIYRQRALVLILVSACLMYPVLAWRYGFLGGMKVMLPPSVALGLTPACLALLGIPFTFFAAMALVLVLSMGVDYAVFCAEDNGRKDPFILFSVALAMGTALLSFGLLASSVIFAVKSFGLTMAIGLPLAYLLAPAAGNVRVVNRRKEGGV